MTSPAQHFFRASAADFKKIPGSPIAYWIKGISCFENTKIGAHYESGGRNKTHNNEDFLRFYWEINNTDIKWKRYANGGEFRKYFGNEIFVINWSVEAREIYESHGGLSNARFWDKVGLTWSLITSARSSFRLKSEFAQYSSGSPTVFRLDSFSLITLMSFLNSPVSNYYLKAINPTINTTVGDVLSLPYISVLTKNEINHKTDMLVAFSIADWDNYETSWDFSDFPLLREHGPWPFSDDRKKPEIIFRSSEKQPIKGKTLAESWENWRTFSQAMISRMKELEEENNRIWIEAYGLQDELSPEVPLKEITLTCNPWYRYSSDNKSEAQLWKLARADSARELLSYAVGCMMGRYSLDKPGLILANQGEGVEEYMQKIGVGSLESGREVERRTSNVQHRTSNDDSQMDLFSDHSALRTPHSPFPPDSNGILPVLDGEWFADDVVARTREFLRVCWGKERMTENLHWLEEALGRELRSYFLNDFYSNHISNDRAYGYKKRPIYWLFQSPKKGFGALVYLHRYNRDTVNTLLNGYLRPYLGKLEDRIKALDHELATASGSALTAARKEQESLRKTLKECQDWEREVLFPLAQKRIELDLDDGVKTNYPKFGMALVKIAGVS